jgi:hypothetical protein
MTVVARRVGGRATFASKVEVSVKSPASTAAKISPSDSGITLSRNLNYRRRKPGGVSVASKERRFLAILLATFVLFLQNVAFSKWAMLDLNQRPPSL